MFKWLKTHYAPQVLSDKQKELVNAVDNALAEMHSSNSTVGEMKVYQSVIPLIYTPLPVSTLVNKLGLNTGGMYIPRSVAFITNPNGDWVVLYAVRDTTGSDEITTTLFIDALTRTNSAR